MYYYCAKLNAFALPQLTERMPGGGIIAASAVPYPQLARRSFMPYPHLQHRMLDPQVYLAGLDPRTAQGTVFKLATYPWFGTNPPAFDSATHRTIAAYKTETMARLLEEWPGRAPTNANGFRKSPAKNREILRENEYQPAIDASVTGDETISVVFALRESEVVGAVGDEAIGFFKRAFIQQELDPLPRRHLPVLMLTFTALFPAAFLRQLVAALQFLQLLFDIHGTGL